LNRLHPDAIGRPNPCVSSKKRPIPTIAPFTEKYSIASWRLSSHISTGTEDTGGCGRLDVRHCRQFVTRRNRPFRQKMAYPRLSREIRKDKRTSYLSPLSSPAENSAWNEGFCRRNSFGGNPGDKICGQDEWPKIKCPTERSPASGCSQPSLFLTSSAKDNCADLNPTRKVTCGSPQKISNVLR
jgi:hypothetical protein